PIVMTEMWLRKRDEHPLVVGRPEDFFEAQVRPGFAAIIMGVDKIDAEAFEPRQRFPCGRVSGERRADLGIIKRHGRQKNPGAIEIKVATSNPEFSKTKADRPAGIGGFAGIIEQRQLKLILILRSVNIPKLFRQPRLRELDAALAQISRSKGLTGEFLDHVWTVRNSRAKLVLGAHRALFERCADAQLLLADRRLHPHIVDSGAGGRADQKDIPTQAAA